MCEPNFTLRAERASGAADWERPFEHWLRQLGWWMKDAIGADYNDFLTRIRLDGTWKVIAKVYHQFES